MLYSKFKFPVKAGWIWLLGVCMLLAASLGLAFVVNASDQMQGRKVVWHHRFDGHVTQATANEKWSRIYLLTDANYLHCLNNSGKELWQHKVPLGRAVRPALRLSQAEDPLVIGGMTKAFRYSTDGELLWEFNSAESRLTSVFPRAPGGKAELVLWDDQELIGLDLEGRVVWASADFDPWVYDRELLCGASGTFYFEQKDRDIIALNPDGSERWRHALSLGGAGRYGISEVAGLVLIQDFEINPKCGRTVDSLIYCLNLDGELQWSAHEGFFDILPPQLCGGNIVCVADWNGAHCFSAFGQHLWKADVQGDILEILSNPDGSNVLLLVPRPSEPAGAERLAGWLNLQVPDFLSNSSYVRDTMQVYSVDGAGQVSSLGGLPAGNFVLAGAGPDGRVLEFRTATNEVVMSRWEELR